MKELIRDRFAIFRFYHYPNLSELINLIPLKSSANLFSIPPEIIKKP